MPIPPPWLLAASMLPQLSLPSQASMLLESRDQRLGMVIASVGRVGVEGRDRTIEYLEMFRGASNGPEEAALDGMSVFVHGGLAGVVPTDTRLARGGSLFLVFSEEDRRALGGTMNAPCVACIAGAGQRLLTTDGFVEVRTSRGDRIDAVAWGAEDGKSDVAGVSRVPRAEAVLMEGDGTWALQRCAPAARAVAGAARWEVRRNQFLHRPTELSSLGVVQGLVSSADGKPIAGASVTLVGETQLAETKHDGSFAFRRVPLGRVEIRVDTEKYASAVWSGDLDATSPIVVHLECQHPPETTRIHATLGPEGGSMRDPEGKWRVDVPPGALGEEVRFRVCRKTNLVRMDQDWGDTDVAAPLQVFLGAVEIEADGKARLAKPVRLWLAVDGTLANAKNRGSVVFEVSKVPGTAQPGRWAADGDDWGVAADVAALGVVAACHQPTADDGVPLAVRALGTTMDANWDGSIDLLDSPATYANVGPGDIAIVNGSATCAMRFESAVPGGGGLDERYLTDLLRSQTVHLSSFGRGGRLGSHRLRDASPLRLECAGDSLGGAKNEVGVLTLFRIVKVSRQVPAAPHGEGKAVGIVLIPIGGGAVVSKRR